LQTVVWFVPDRINPGVGARKSVVGAELRIRRRGNPAMMIGP
jgi:hypothetical protein